MIKNKKRIAYFTTRYPSVSHTFIRRELLEIEKNGFEVSRITLRKTKDPIVDPKDVEENAKTISCLNRHPIKILYYIILRFFQNPYNFLSGIIVALNMSKKSEKGILKHFAYFCEACILYHIAYKKGIEHIHVHFGTNVAAVARITKYLGGPTYSFTVHGPAEFDSPNGFDLRGKIKDSKFTVAITDYCSAQLKRWSDINDWEKIKVIHCALGTDFFSNFKELNKDTKNFVCVGRLSAQKGHFELIYAFALLNKDFPETKLILVGDGELRKEIESLISQLNLESQIVITGYVSEKKVREYIHNSRALVLPSFAEGLPMVIMEAFSLGRTVISTFIAGIPELVRPGDNGWLVPAANRESLRQAMEEVLTSQKSELNSLATNGYKKTKENHSIEIETAKLIDLLSEK